MSHKICPICGTPAHPNAAVCSTCGASLRSVRQVSANDENEANDSLTAYDHRYGETDLAESALKWKGGTYLLGAMLTVTLLVCVGGVFFAGSRLYGVFLDSRGIVRLSPSPVSTQSSAESFATNTVQPTQTLFLPTVTVGPPTASRTPTAAPTDTPGPCMQEIQPNDSLIAAVSRCGHRDLDVIDLVLEINNIESPELIYSGQVLEIPWPTTTPDPAANPSPENTDEAADVAVAMVDDTSVDAQAAPPFEPGQFPTATLQPGVAWHRVVKDENIIIIAYNYGANIKILSELNPEVTFSQCDFGLDTGGDKCIVQIFEGQLLRVPAPTPTPTLSPTPSGSETATPTATATFNAPSALSPGNRTLFQNGEFVTLRWVASGTLAPEQVYRVRVKDTTNGAEYTADTTELFFIIPKEWQGQDNRRHEYTWAVSVIDSSNPDNPYFTTETRVFIWEAPETPEDSAANGSNQ